jgi:hypothetical protein
MKKNFFKTVLIILLLAGSCDEPKTTVTNIVHRDGSVTRIIEMKNSLNNITFDNVQVPFDSTWNIKDTVLIENGKDTTWMRRAEKHFNSVAEITGEYQTEKGLNTDVDRYARFSKKFRWFHTIVRFSENISPTMRYGYDPAKFLDTETLEFYYLPDFVYSEMEAGPDSLKYRMLRTRADSLSDVWIWNSLASEWIEETSLLATAKGIAGFDKNNLKLREDEIVDMLINSEGTDIFDDQVFRKLLGIDYEMLRNEADSAYKILEKRVDPGFSFSSYSVRSLMPGKVISTNGYMLDNGMIEWPVRSEFFLCSPYEMWAESRITNWWAWVISAVFLTFVVYGLILRKM